MRVSVTVAELGFSLISDPTYIRLSDLSDLIRLIRSDLSDLSDYPIRLIRLSDLSDYPTYPIRSDLIRLSDLSDLIRLMSYPIRLIRRIRSDPILFDYPILKDKFLKDKFQNHFGGLDLT